MSVCGTINLVKEEPPPHYTIKRRSDEPKLQIGDRVSFKDGIGVVLARYTPAGRQNEVCYIVEIIADQSEKGKARKP